VEFGCNTHGGWTTSTAPSARSAGARCGSLSQARGSYCDECVALCNDINRQGKGGGAATLPATARELYDEIDRYVIGQERAKKALSVSVYNHYKRIGQRGKAAMSRSRKGNILLIGPPAAAKTLLVQHPGAQAGRFPFAMADATTLTEAGYVGDRRDSVIKALYRNAGNDPDKAARGSCASTKSTRLRARGAAFGDPRRFG